MQKESIELVLIAITAGLAFLHFVISDLPSMMAYYPKLFLKMTTEGYLTRSVFTSDGIPAPNFKPIIYHKDSGALIKVVQTDANGNYGLLLNVGDYMTVTRQGTYEVTIESGKTTTLNIPA
ncbi:MAG: carboxypeptidase-like regulatory domain-containing protein [Thermoproteota archaeon]